MRDMVIPGRHQEAGRALNAWLHFHASIDYRLLSGMSAISLIYSGAVFV